MTYSDEDVAFLDIEYRKALYAATRTIISPDASEAAMRAALSTPTTPKAWAPIGWKLVPETLTPEMLAAGLNALSEWRKTLTRDEAMMRSYRPHDGREFIASATPEEKMAIRWGAMLAIAPEPEIATVLNTACQAGAVSEWKPIDDEAKNGKPIWVGISDPPNMIVCAWSSNGWEILWSGRPLPYEPTHCRNIGAPPPPETGGR